LSVDGGGSRAELESGYHVSRLEPVIVAPDFTDEAMADVDDALQNVGNVYAMRDGCADGWRGDNWSYPNGGLYVYEPPEAAGTGDDSTGGTATEVAGGCGVHRQRYGGVGCGGRRGHDRPEGAGTGRRHRFGRRRWGRLPAAGRQPRTTATERSGPD